MFCFRFLLSLGEAMRNASRKPLNWISPDAYFIKILSFDFNANHTFYIIEMKNVNLTQNNMIFKDVIPMWLLRSSGRGYSYVVNILILMLYLLLKCYKYSSISLPLYMYRYEIVNVNLKYKPDWFLKLNPRGLVPIIEKDGVIIYESTATCEWLDDMYPENRLQPNDPHRKALDRMLLEYFGQVRYKVANCCLSLNVV